MNPLSLLPSVFGFKGMGIALALGLTVGGFGSWKVTETFCDAAAARVELANVQSKLDAANRDLKASQQAAANAVAANGVIQQSAQANEEKVHDLETQLAAKPVPCRALDADGLRRLLDIAPR